MIVYTETYTDYDGNQRTEDFRFHFSQAELLEMAKISGFIGRAKGLGRPTKKERREIDALMDQFYYDEEDI